MALRRRNAKRSLNKSSSNSKLSDTPKLKNSSRIKKPNTVNSFKDLISPEARNSNRIYNNKHCKDETHSINISDILKLNFKVYRVSPIFNFNDKKLKIYERKLVDELTAINYQKENITYKATFLCGRLELDRVDSVIQICVTSGNKKYNGYLISLVADNKDFSSLKHFPVLLVQGGGQLVNQVHSIICKFFDCDIHPAVFSFQALMTVFTSMAHFFADQVSDLSSEEVSLHYKVPGCAISDSIVVAIPLAATSTVFAMFTHEFGEVLNTSQLILGFYNRIINQILNVYRIDLSPAELFKISFPFCTISSEGWVKFSSLDIIGRILLIIENFIKLEYNIHL